MLAFGVGGGLFGVGRKNENVKKVDGPHVWAHRHSLRNRAELERSDVCGCFYCSAIYSPAEIVEWIDDGQTAICARCPVDSVIGSASGHPITVKFLERMHAHWF